MSHLLLSCGSTLPSAAQLPVDNKIAHQSFPFCSLAGPEISVPMKKAYTADQRFDKVNVTQDPLPPGEYDNCEFLHCDFSQCNLSGFTFTDCLFHECNLSLARLDNTSLRDARFKDCKLMGLRWDTCNPFGLSFSFEQCLLDHSSFFQVKARKTRFTNCRLRECDFVECDLHQSVFDNCDLLGAVFERTLLEKTDFRTAFNYTIHPESNKIKKARFSLQGIPGLLARYDIDISL